MALNLQVILVVKMQYVFAIRQPDRDVLLIKSSLGAKVIFFFLLCHVLAKVDGVYFFIQILPRNMRELKRYYKFYKNSKCSRLKRSFVM